MDKKKKKKNTKTNEQLCEPVGKTAGARELKRIYVLLRGSAAAKRSGEPAGPLVVSVFGRRSARLAVDGGCDGRMEMGEKKKMYAITVQVDRACRVVASVEHDDAGHGSGCHRGSRSKHK